MLYDGSPAYPDAAGSWSVAAETGATTFGMGAAHVTACEQAGVRLAEEFDLAALRTVIPTGSPLPPSGWHWLNDRLAGQVRIDPIAGGTDVCTAFVGGSVLLRCALARSRADGLGSRLMFWTIVDGRYATRSASS